MEVPFTSDIGNIGSIVGVEVFDVVVISGVFGYGVNTDEQFSRAIESLNDIIRDEGILVVGWNVGRPIEPNSENVRVVEKYFDPLEDFQGLPFNKTFGTVSHEFHIFKKRSSQHIPPA